MADKPFVLDPQWRDLLCPQAFRLLSAVDDKCLTVGVEWAMVAGDAVTRQLRARSDEALFPVVGSVAEAGARVRRSRHAPPPLVLPLLGNTA